MPTRRLLLLVTLVAAMVAPAPAHADTYVPHGCKNPWKLGQPRPNTLSFRGIRVVRVRCGEAYEVVKAYAVNNVGDNRARRQTIVQDHRWTCYPRLIDTGQMQYTRIVCKARGLRRIRVLMFS